MSRNYRAISYTDQVIGALQALERGDASADQQKRALKWIVEEAGRKDSDCFFDDGEGGDRASAFMSGRRFVALEILKLVYLTRAARDALLKQESKHGRSRNRD